MGLIYGHRRRLLRAGGGTPTVLAATWDPNAVAQDIVLSNNNLTAANTATDDQWNNGHATPFITPASGRKYYAEFNADLLPAASPPGVGGIGVANGSNIIILGNYLGIDTNSLGFYPSSGEIYYNAAVLTTLQSGAQGDTIQMAVDLGNSLVWFNINNGNWNNSASDSPASGTGGISITSITGEATGPGVALYSSSPSLPVQFTANFGATAFKYTAPSGFVGWPATNP